MKVKELIAKLQEFNGELEVMEVGGCGCCAREVEPRQLSFFGSNDDGVAL